MRFKVEPDPDGKYFNVVLGTNTEPKIAIVEGFDSQTTAQMFIMQYLLQLSARGAKEQSDKEKGKEK